MVRYSVMVEEKVCELEECVESFSAGRGKRYCCENHAQKASYRRRFRYTPDLTQPTPGTLLTCALPGCPISFVLQAAYPRKRFCSRVHGEMMRRGRGFLPEGLSQVERVCALESCQQTFVPRYGRKFCSDICCRISSHQKPRKRTEGAGPPEEGTSYKMWCQLRGYDPVSRSYT